MAIWVDFFRDTANCLKLLGDQTVPIERMTTIFAAALHYGVAPWLAWVLQGSVSLGIAALVAYTWYKEIPFYLRASALVLGILLVTPYAFPYDLAMLMLPLAWLGWEGYTQGWLSWEPEVLLFGWLSPLIIVTLNLMGLNFFPPLILCGLLLLVWRRIQMIRVNSVQ
jgi:hypothetical protein